MINRNLNYEVLFNEMIDFTYNYIKKNNLNSVVLGISGGIDSTVVAALLYEVDKKYENWYNTLTDKDKKKFNYRPLSFYGISMPSDTTDSNEYYISTLVGYAFCNKRVMGFNTLNISYPAELIIESCGFDKKDYPYRSGNIKSRLRMIYLYDMAKAHNGIVVGTDNFTEKLLGFSTIGGDALADYMPIQYLWKTEVYGLANYLLEKYKNEENWAAVNAINESIKLPPQDGLGISNSDMDQIGAKNYYDVDEILYAYIKTNGYNDNYAVNEVNNEFVDTVYPQLIKKFTKSVVEKVLNRYINNFKLKHPIEFINNELIKY